MDRQAAATPGHREARGTLTIDVEARSVQPGESRGPRRSTRRRERHRASAICAFNRAVFNSFAVGDGKWQALVGIDLDVAGNACDYRRCRRCARGSRTDRQSQTFRTRRLTVDPAFVTPPPSAEARTKPTRSCWHAPGVVGERTALGIALHPPRSGRSQQRIRHPQYFQTACRATPTAAPTSCHQPERRCGRRTLARGGRARPLLLGQYGRDRPRPGLFSMLAQSLDLRRSEGESIENGALVGRVGATGRVTGAHLHWAVRTNGARVDPLSLLAVLGKPNG